VPRSEGLGPGPDPGAMVRSNVSPMTESTSPSGRAAFDGVLTAHGNNTGIVVPAEVMDQLGAGKRPPVAVVVNGYEFRSTVGVMSGQFLIGVSAAIRKETALAAGDDIHVELRVETAPREVDLPADFAIALDAAPGARVFFDGLSNSLQRYYVDQVKGAKTAETRERRIAKAVDLFVAGKKR
jgi:hypothetical protein